MRSFSLSLKWFSLATSVFSCDNLAMSRGFYLRPSVKAFFGSWQVAQIIAPALHSVRFISMRHYSIFYKIHDEMIVTVSFWDNRQDAEKLLKILKDI
jgi:hypothetical protein